MVRCWVVDDDCEIRHLMGANNIDVVVLDLMLPDDNGLALCRWAQKEHARTPIIMLTAQGDPASRVVGLEMGADDYLAKPFEPRELVARIHAVLRRSSQNGDRGADAAKRRTVQFDGWRFDRVLRQLISPTEVVVVLSNAEFRLLSAFVDSPGRVLTRDQLIDLSRAPGVEVSDRSIDLCVSRLRQKLGPSSKENGIVRTLRGEGSLFDAEVR